jgi:HTH-type transcriptional regulator / antitoxin MqsA
MSFSSSADKPDVRMCGICGGEARLVHEPHAFTVAARTVTIDDELYRCERCGEGLYFDDMLDATFRRAAAVLRAEDGLLAPDDIVALRAKYGLTQAQLERLIGAGEKTVVRWERGTVAQNKTADTLLRVLLDHPEVVAQLAGERKVKLRAPAAAPPAKKPRRPATRRTRADAAD